MRSRRDPFVIVGPEEKADMRTSRPSGVGLSFMRSLAKQTAPPKGGRIAALLQWHHARLDPEFRGR